jgi:hypothetical protein
MITTSPGKTREPAVSNNPNLVMALRGGDRLVGVLEAHDHRSPWRGFGVSDKHTVLTLTHELGNAIANRQLEDRLRHDASHDPVTGLLNRPGFEAAHGTGEVACSSSLSSLRVECRCPGMTVCGLRGRSGFRWLGLVR